MLTLSRRALLLSAGALAGCTVVNRDRGGAAPEAVPALVPIRAQTDRIFDIAVCLRPFRAAGPRLDVERVGDTLVVHNYGHGGSGWSLSWGSGTVAVRKAMAGSPREVAAIGCGVAAVPMWWLISRLRSGYFAIATWVLATAIMLFIERFPSIGGGTGMSLPGLSGYDPTLLVAYTYWIGLAVTVLSLVTVYVMLRGRIGLVLTAMRAAGYSGTSLGEVSGEVPGLRG